VTANVGRRSFLRGAVLGAGVTAAAAGAGVGVAAGSKDAPAKESLPFHGIHPGGDPPFPSSTVHCGLL
jgi:hypothetical protein